jgi:hypothetical protein
MSLKDMKLIPMNSAHARLPDNYIAAKEALQQCAKKFTPERYARAMAALETCLAVDECASWPKEAALSSYAAQANDDSVERLCRRVNKKRAKWQAEATGSKGPVQYDLPV